MRALCELCVSVAEERQDIHTHIDSTDRLPLAEQLRSLGTRARQYPTPSEWYTEIIVPAQTDGSLRDITMTLSPLAISRIRHTILLR